MEGGTVFHFVTEGIEAALAQAKAAARNLDVKIGGGVFTVRQYLQAGLIDELHFAIAPVVLGRGEAIFYGVDLPGLGFRVTEHAATGHATHLEIVNAVLTVGGVAFERRAHTDSHYARTPARARHGPSGGVGSCSKRDREPRSPLRAGAGSIGQYMN
jgi:hypothetical protein